jgi:hypothetical protein
MGHRIERRRLASQRTIVQASGTIGRGRRELHRGRGERETNGDEHGKRKKRERKKERRGAAENQQYANNRERARTDKHLHLQGEITI